MWTVNYSHDDNHWQIRAGWDGPLYTTTPSMSRVIELLTIIGDATDVENYRMWTREKQDVRRARVLRRIEQLRKQRREAM